MRSQTPASLRSLLRVYGEAQDGNNPVAAVRRRKPGCYDRRERRNIWLAVLEDTTQRIVRGVRRAVELLGEALSGIGLKRIQVGRWDNLILFHPTGSSFAAIYVSTQDKLRPRDVQRILRMLADNRRRACCVTDELVIIVYRDATVEAERMLKAWARESPRTRLLVKEDVLTPEGRRRAAKVIKKRLRRFFARRLTGLIKRIRSLVARGIRGISAKLTVLVVLLVMIAAQLGLVRDAPDMLVELRTLVHYAPSDTGPPPPRLLAVLEKHLDIEEV